MDICNLCSKELDATADTVDLLKSMQVCPECNKTYNDLSTLAAHGDVEARQLVHHAEHILIQGTSRAALLEYAEKNWV